LNKTQKDMAGMCLRNENLAFLQLSIHSISEG